MKDNFQVYYIVAFAINDTKIYNNDLYNTQYTYHLLVFNSTKTTRSMYSCIFYCVDNSISGSEEPLQFFSASNIVEVYQKFSKPTMLFTTG